MSGSVVNVLPPAAVADVVDVVDAAVAKLAKPGPKTTEFLTLAITFAGAIATLAGAFNTSSAQANGIIKAVGLIAAAVASAGYSSSRGNAKAALGALASTVVATRGAPQTTTSVTVTGAPSAPAEPDAPDVSDPVPDAALDPAPDAPAVEGG